MSPYVFSDVEKLIEDYYIMENEKIYNNDSIKINTELENYENKYADLFLIAIVKKLQSEGKKVLLITEETFRKDGKLIQKLPIICKNEKIPNRRIPFALFEHYKDELEFTLKIK